MHDAEEYAHDQYDDPVVFDAAEMRKHASSFHGFFTDCGKDRNDQDKQRKVHAAVDVFVEAAYFGAIRLRKYGQGYADAKKTQHEARSAEDRCPEKLGNRELLDREHFFQFHFSDKAIRNGDYEKHQLRQDQSCDSEISLYPGARCQKQDKKTGLGNKAHPWS